ncbi:hypothetical protein POVCU2_0025120 [Plasmodium ovale curtisi]|uniref:Uncharacterized protein n=1 Tax=Plasmodium ovale curtisi TaxID=864141 RepID=A0A1A8VUK9_PLAOA|nr:hypothetical protein POVCU2_0025120 [Plasmodium ovale curtisi]SBS92417.1 hypothetical protein POVCU1_022950 [Plasmodium ovale curtisi]
MIEGKQSRTGSKKEKAAKWEKRQKGKSSKKGKAAKREKQQKGKSSKKGKAAKKENYITWKTQSSRTLVSKAVVSTFYGESFAKKVRRSDIDMAKVTPTFCAYMFIRVAYTEILHMGM